MSRGDTSSCVRRGEAITTVIVWLLMGAIVNVAVAWGFVLCPMPLREIDQAAFQWPIDVPEGFSRPDSFYGFESWGVSRLGAWTDTASGFSGSLTVRLSGWPSRALYAERHYVKTYLGIPGVPRFDAPKRISDGIAIPNWITRGKSYECFPTRPIWPGFAINTVFYAFGLWLLFAAPFALRRRRQVKRGLCPKCAYPVGTSTVCTECGAAHAVNRMAG